MGLFDRFKNEKCKTCVDYAKKFREHYNEYNMYTLKKANKLLKSWERDYPNDPNLYYGKIIIEFELSINNIKNSKELQQLTNKIERLQVQAMQLQPPISQSISSYGPSIRIEYFDHNKWFQRKSNLYLMEIKNIRL